MIAQGKGKEARREVYLVHVDEKGRALSRWKPNGAWPSKYEGPDLVAKGNDAGIEVLEIIHEGIDRVY